jgi:hypothetical protein
MITATLPELLQWAGTRESYDAVHTRYVELLAGKLAQLCARIAAVDAPLAERISILPGQISPDGLLRALTAPETSFRLLYGCGRDDRAVARFLLEAVHAEQIRQGDLRQSDALLWTALGDTRFARAKSETWPQSDRLPPLDFGSPYAATVDLSGQDRTEFPARPTFSADEQQKILLLLLQAIRQVEQTLDLVADFVRRFNKVVILQKDGEAPTKFSSGSNGHYVGRTFLANPQLPAVECLADALVHEAIHGLLYMGEQLEPWFTDPAARSSPRIPSPWTGSILTLPSYLQACFVWFGLLNFWSLAYARGAVEPGVAHKYMYRALCGFLRGSLRNQIGEARTMVAPDILQDIDRMQDIVRKAYASAA